MDMCYSSLPTRHAEIKCNRVVFRLGSKHAAVAFSAF